MASNFIRGFFDPLEKHPAQLTFNGDVEAEAPRRFYTDAERMMAESEAFHKIVGFATIHRPAAILDLGVTDTDRLKWLVDYIDRLDSELRGSYPR
jgi:hypothetical protein